jgi:hypothetical protein
MVLNNIMNKYLAMDFVQACINEILNITKQRLPNICLTGSVAILLFAHAHNHSNKIKTLLNSLPFPNDYDFIVLRNGPKTNDYIFKLDKPFIEFTSVLPHGNVKSASHIIESGKFKGIKFDLTLVDNIKSCHLMFDNTIINVLLPEKLLLYYDDQSEITMIKKELLRSIIAERNNMKLVKSHKKYLYYLSQADCDELKMVQPEKNEIITKSPIHSKKITFDSPIRSNLSLK